MLAVVLAAVAFMIWTFQSIVMVPERALPTAGEADAASFLHYHQAAADWAARTSAASGSAASLELPAGDAPRTDWGHLVVEGRLYSFTQATYTVTPGFLAAVAGAGGRACRRPADDSALLRCTWGDMPLPSSLLTDVAAGAVVMAGG
ncbi:MAG: hypothetical protein KA795_08215 [Burkholderiaceae bacterium]|nr:hypothetical protein [Burkholderiaceae bacterium]